MSRPLSVTVADVTYRYPDGRLALDGCSLHVPAGERIAVLGPNGAGKSTLVLHLNGLLEPEQGTVTVGDLAVVPATFAEVRRQVGLVFQDPDDQLFMPTVADDVAFGPQQSGFSDDAVDAAVDRALGAVDMAGFGDRAPHHLSFGQRRRVAIATALATDPGLLVLDEPTANLDPAARVELVDVLRRLHHTVVVVTHDLPFALQVCPRSVILDAGQVVADGRTAELLADSERMAAHRLPLPFGFDPRTKVDPLR